MKLLVFKSHNSILVICNRFSKMSHFIVITEKIIAERLTRLFSDNIQKLHKLLESVILNRGPQFITELIKELNEILEIKTKLLTAFHLQTDGQTERTNQKLEQYLRIYTFTKSSLFKTNYEKELRIDFEIRKIRKYAKTEEFVKKMKEIYEKMKVILKKSQKKIKK